jgi:hypothetical protein
VRSRPDLLVPALAAVFGLLTWTVAHVVTYAFFAHTHLGPDAFAHVPEGAGPPAVGVGAFLLTALAAAAAGSPVRPWSSRLQPGARSAACAPAAFVAVESGEHIVRGGEAPPAALLVIGVVVHTVVGAGTPWLWRGFVRPAVLALLVAAARCPARRPRGPSVPVDDADRPATPPLALVAGRDPPGRGPLLASLSGSA